MMVNQMTVLIQLLDEYPMTVKVNHPYISQKIRLKTKITKAVHLIPFCYTQFKSRQKRAMHIYGYIYRFHTTLRREKEQESIQN